MADDVTPLEDLVGQLRQEGSGQDSGRFSLDLRQAAERIGGLENRPGLYLLKLVQAAVAGGCSQIQIRLGRSQVDFRALGPELFSRQQVTQALDGPFQPSLGSALDHLAWAIFLARPILHLSLGLPSGTYDSRQGWQESPYADGFRLVLQRSTPWLNWLAGLAAASQEHALLYERCAYAPIPIWLDGRRINDADRLDRWIPGGELRPPSFFQFVPFAYSFSEILVERNLLRQQGPQVVGTLPSLRTVRNLRLGDDFYEVSSKTMDQNLRVSPVHAVHLYEWMIEPAEWPVSTYEGPEQGTYPLARARGVAMDQQVLAVAQEVVDPYLSQIPAGLPLPYHRDGWIKGKPNQNFERNLPLVQLRLTLPLGLQGPSRLLTVRHGVALDPYSGPFSYPGLVVLAAEDEVRTDLSQLRPLQDEVFYGLLARVQQQASEMVADFWEVIGDRYPTWVLDHLKKGLNSAP